MLFRSGLVELAGVSEAYAALYERYGGEIPDREKAAFYAGVDKFRASALDESFMYSVTAFYRQAAGSMP